MADAKLPASSVNILSKGTARALSATATGAIIPIVYGRTAVSGYVFMWGITGSPEVLTVGVAWCLGEAQVENVFINDALIPSTGVEVVHYPGRDDQPVDPWLAALQSPYTDDLVYTTSTSPAESVGVCYSVFRIDKGAIDNAPRFSAIINGRPAEGATDTFAPPYSASTVFLLTFWTDTVFTGSPLTATENSPYQHTVTLGNGATVTGITNYVDFDGVDSFATWAQSSEFNLGSENWCIELTTRTDTITSNGNRTLLNVGTSTTRCIILYRNTAALYLAVSTDGTTYAIQDTFFTMSANTDYDVCVERCGQFIHCYVDGDLKAAYYIGTDAINYPSGDDWYLGSYNGTSNTGWNGRLEAFRMTVGHYRYGATYDHLTKTDYYDFRSGYTKEYTDNPALAWGDMATDTIIGLGATIDTDYRRQARDWCDDLGLNGSTVKRAQTGITITAARRAESWLDLLAEYANCIWYIEGGTVYLRPDRPATDGVYAAGQELVTNGTFDADSNWSKGTGWSISGGVATSDGSQVSTSDLSQSVTVTSGKTYAIAFDFIKPTLADKTGFGGSVSLLFGGSTLVSGINTSGRYGGTFTASSSSHNVVIRATADFEGGFIDNVSVREVYHTETDWIEGSLSIEGAAQDGTPTQVQLRYSVPSDTSGAWEEDVAIQELAGVATGAVPLVQTTVYMPGVQNQYEAADKAEARLNRVQNRLRVSYVCADHGIARTPGDIVNLVNATRGIDIYIKVESIDLVAPGRYRVTGALYDSTHYPN